VAAATDILPPRYLRPERIARGGMGEIYRATDSSLGRTVAIKVLAERFAEDEPLRERFTREALAAARLSGEPNIVTIFDVGEHAERPYIVMEYLSGGSLDDVLRAKGAQPPERVVAWLEEAARALDAAHRKGVVHRDVKPANLMLDKEGHVNVADFGVASAAGMESLTATGTILGTAGYLAPERAQGDPAGPASDLYALGVVAWELLTGSRPFEADSPTAEAAAHVHAPVPDISERSALPPSLDPVFHRALAKNAAERYASPGELVAALRAALADDAGTTAMMPAPTPRPVDVPRPPSERRTAWFIVAGLLIAGALAGAGAAYLLTRDDGTPTTVVRTRERTVTSQGRLTTVERRVTVTTARVTSAPVTSAGPSAIALNNAGFAKLQQRDFKGALPLLEQAVAKLSGTGSRNEAYADYNLALARFATGSCTGVVALLDRSESIQGMRKEIDRLRHQVEKDCEKD
jgi:predicted Ser/Thr protein kinase